jgi:predicted glutamine amidotransferase
VRVFAPATTPSRATQQRAVCREEEWAGGWTILAFAKRERNIMATKYGTRRPTFSYSRRGNQYAECAIISSPLFDNETHTSFPEFFFRVVWKQGD